MMDDKCTCSCHRKKTRHEETVEVERDDTSSDEGEGFTLKNCRIKHEDEDILYHLALGNKSHDLVEMFGDVKFVCMGGTVQRMEKFAYYILQEIGFKISPGTMLQDLSAKSNRYALYKIGPVMSVSHGMGMPSLSILLHELIKLMYHAGVKNPFFFRLGTCGGVGIKPGSVVVTTEALNGELEPVHKLAVLGKMITRPAYVDQDLANEICQLQKPEDHFQICGGKTISTDDFYEGQGRLDGAFCGYTEKEKLAFLNCARSKGVVNFEMEALALAAITHEVGIKSATICVTLLDRLNGDQICQPKQTLLDWQDRPMVIAGRYIKKYLQTHPKIAKRYAMVKSYVEVDENIGIESGRALSPRGSLATGSSIVVSSVKHLERVMDESNTMDE